ncbi:MAG TPA: NAD-dependent epimerase/dehydratase family protein [Gaiellaceae bacterium]|nr:NAD-dependent epimerase/dehydratase family protein [Gaiellaceae bacterium]
MDPFHGKKVVITGGLGFIGSNLARALIAGGAAVVLVDSLVPDYGGNRANIAGIEDRVTVNISDVRDPHSLVPLLRGQDVLFNLAGQTSHLDSMVDPFTDLEINCRSQLSILEACRRHNPEIKIVFASTRQIYGRPRFLPVDEEHPVAPVDVNGIDKAAGEAYHLLYGEVYGLRVCALRLTNVYGPRMRVRDARQTFLGVWLKAVVRGERFEVWGDGTQRRDLLYVDDAVQAFLLAGARDEADGQVFNVGVDSSVSLRELAELLVRLHGSGAYDLVSFPRERRAIDIGDYFTCADKIRAALGWEARVPLEEGLRRTLAYYDEHGDAYW